MASLQAKIGWKRQRKRENENCRSVPFRSYSMCNRKFQENCKKIPLWLHFKPKQVGKGRERAKIKIIVPFRSYPTRYKKFQKNSKKIQKIKKYNNGFISIQNWLEKDEIERK